LGRGPRQLFAVEDYNCHPTNVLVDQRVTSEGSTALPIAPMGAPPKKSGCLSADEAPKVLSPTQGLSVEKGQAEITELPAGALVSW
jgi:hypothetical protein